VKPRKQTKKKGNHANKKETKKTGSEKQNGSKLEKRMRPEQLPCFVFCISCGAKLKSKTACESG